MVSHGAGVLSLETGSYTNPGNAVSRTCNRRLARATDIIADRQAGGPRYSVIARPSSRSRRRGRLEKVEVVPGATLAVVRDRVRHAASWHRGLERLPGLPSGHADHPDAISVDPRPYLDEPWRAGHRVGLARHARVDVIEPARFRVVHGHEDIGHEGLRARRRPE